MKKRCPKCEDTKELDEFNCNKRNRDGRQDWCKICANTATKKWQQENPEKNKARAKKWRKENPEKVKADHKRWNQANPEKLEAWKQKNPEKYRNIRLKHKFGITLNEYNEMLAAQGNRCAICGEAWGEGQRRPCVDHDHSMSGRESVRGIVHRQCNMLLGHAEKNPGLFDKINQYLEKHSTSADTSARYQEKG